MYGYIYITTNLVNNKRYIGKRKWNAKIDEDTYLGSGTIFVQAVRKYGKSNFLKEVLYVANSENELNEKEKYYIDKYNAIESKQFYNLAEGGNGGNTWKGLSEHRKNEIKKKISKSLTGVPQPSRGLPGPLNPMYKKGYLFKGELNHMYGKTHSEKTREKIRKKATGRVVTQKTREKLKIATIKVQFKSGKNHILYGTHPSDETREKLKIANKRANNPRAIPVIRMNWKKLALEIYYCINDACDFGFEKHGIIRCCKGKQSTHGGYWWCYSKDYPRVPILEAEL